ncbi:MAG TPA: malonyl-CoA decarboxylase [Hyphomicrobiaceae bacterium]|nr:malonyl-CoA decarboxylase [Hyphomicrobiaceae bacterium]
MPANTSFLQDLLTTIAERGRQLIPQSLIGGGRRDDIQALAKALLTSQGEASGVAIAREILTKYRSMSVEGRRAFVRFVAETMQPDRESVLRAATSFIASPDDASLSALQAAVESPRQEFFRRLNLAPGATGEIVALRADLLKQGRADPALRGLDQDLQHLLYSWFNRGFLVLRRIDWQTPAAVLEKIIAYEAVHEIKGWEDLRRRLDPADRRLFAFFHPAMVDEPLIFVEVALTDVVPGSIQAVLGEHRKPAGTRMAPTVAVFYSISNCQEGLRGISFGNFLIKQVVEELVRELPTLKTFVTLSPVPGFARWLDRELAAPEAANALIPPADRSALAALRRSNWADADDEGDSLRGPLLGAAAAYFLRARTSDGHPVDPVARFHLGNGARLDRLNWLGDVSEKGMREAHGLMVNYRYELDEIEANHEAYENAREVAASKSVRSLLRAPEKPRSDVTRRLPSPGR